MKISKNNREDLSLMAIKLDPRILQQFHTVLRVHVFGQVELEVELEELF